MQLNILVAIKARIPATLPTHEKLCYSMCDAGNEKYICFIEKFFNNTLPLL